MNLLKTSVLSAIETAVKLASGFVVIKFIATAVGPEGVAYFGQFQNFIAAIVIMISGGFTTGLVRYSAQERSGHSGSHYLGNALGLGIIVSCMVSVCIYAFSGQLSSFIFQTQVYSNIFKLLACCSILIMVFQVTIAVLNGWGELTKLIICKSISSLSLLIISISLVSSYGLLGGLIGLIAMQAISGFIGIGLLCRIKTFEWQWIKPRFNFSIYKKFMPYWLMSMTTLCSTPLILMLIRSYIASKIGWEEAGIWEASWKLSELYMLVISTALMTYYVPKLSQAKNQGEEIGIVKEVLLLGVISASFLATLIYAFRHWVVYYLFSENFYEVTEILGFQLIGSVIKLAAWVFAYHMIVTCRTKLFLSFELIFGASFYLFARWFLDAYGLIGVSYATAVNCSLYLFFCCMYFYKYNNIKRNYVGDPQINRVSLS